MSRFEVTQRDSAVVRAQGSGDSDPVPGLLAVFAAGLPACVAVPLDSKFVEYGRASLPDPLPADSKMSRRHASVCWDGKRFRIQDHGSQNGTFIDGVRVQSEISTSTARVLRMGDTLFLFSRDVSPQRTRGVQSEGHVILGPLMQDVMAQTRRAAQYGSTLYIIGESGSGKEGVARAFHAASRGAGGPFVAVNCATIAVGLAERLLFGARRGAYSGADSDADGLLQAADGGTLFLDEIAELDQGVQAKLLRVLETREILPLGAVRPRQISLQLCSASHRNLRTELALGRFREDLYFRIAIPEIVVPSLRQRPEEIPWLILDALTSLAPNLGAHSSFVEACMLRHWPGNVRELLGAVRSATQNALGSGARKLESQHLPASAGQTIERQSDPAPKQAGIWTPQASRAANRPSPARSELEEALAQTGGNISAAARRLGLHRTQLKRAMEKHGLVPADDAAPDDGEPQ